jgi:hypothetical protein
VCVSTAPVLDYGGHWYPPALLASSTNPRGGGKWENPRRRRQRRLRTNGRWRRQTCAAGERTEGGRSWFRARRFRGSDIIDKAAAGGYGGATARRQRSGGALWVGRAIGMNIHHETLHDETPVSPRLYPLPSTPPRTLAWPVAVITIPRGENLSPRPQQSMASPPVPSSRPRGQVVRQNRMDTRPNVGEARIPPSRSLGLCARGPCA